MGVLRCRQPKYCRALAHLVELAVDQKLPRILETFQESLGALTQFANELLQGPEPFMKHTNDLKLWDGLINI